MSVQYSLRSPAVKRLMREAEELCKPSDQYHAAPLDDNLFEWHFTIRGPSDSEFEGGIYHGRILLPTEYPMKPPSIILLTPNGRFELYKKICLSISGYHPESWQPSWSIRTALLAIIGFMPTQGKGAIGSLDYPADQRKKLALKSKSFSCGECGAISEILKEETAESKAASNAEAKMLASQIDMQGEKSKNNTSEKQKDLSNEKVDEEPKISDSEAVTSQPQNTIPSNDTLDDILQPFDGSDHNSARTPQNHSDNRSNAMFLCSIAFFSLIIAVLVLRRIFILMDESFNFSNTDEHFEL